VRHLAQAAPHGNGGSRQRGLRDSGFGTKNAYFQPQAETEQKAEETECLWSEFESNEVYRRFELPEAIEISPA
jgi:hypothetical protein